MVLPYKNYNPDVSCCPLRTSPHTLKEIPTPAQDTCKCPGSLDLSHWLGLWFLTGARFLLFILCFLAAPLSLPRDGGRKIIFPSNLLSSAGYLNNMRQINRRKYPDLLHMYTQGSLTQGHVRQLRLICHPELRSRVGGVWFGTLKGRKVIHTAVEKQMFGK